MESRHNGDDVVFIYEDNHLLVADKPSGMPSQPDASGDRSLDVAAKDYLRRKYDKPGEVYLGLLHRLDRPTSGVVLMARTGKAAGRMADLFRRREIEKRYLALVECHAEPKGTEALRTLLVPAGNGGMTVSKGKSEGVREARLSYRLLGRSANGRRALLEVNLETGVKHQIRCQLAWAGLPVVGDFRYGASGEVARPEPVAGGRAVLLHAWRVRFVHPVRREELAIAAPVPGHWRGYLDGFPDIGPELTRGEYPA